MPRGGGGGGRRLRLPHAAHPSAAPRGQECRSGRRTDAAALAARSERCQRDLRGLDPLAGVAAVADLLERPRRLRLVCSPASSPRRHRLHGELLRIDRCRLAFATAWPHAVRSASGRMDRRGLPRSARAPRRSRGRRGHHAPARCTNRLGSSSASRWCVRFQTVTSYRERSCLQSRPHIANPNQRRRIRGRVGSWRWRCRGGRPIWPHGDGGMRSRFLAARR